MIERKLTNGFMRVGTLGTGSAMDAMNRLREQARQKRAAMIAERGWSDQVECVECGDSGIVWRPDTTGPGPDMTAPPCLCSAGVSVKKREETERWWRDSVPVRLNKYRLETSPRRAAADAMQAWIDTAPWTTGENALLIGAVGTGKTGLAIGAMRSALDLGITVELIIISDWLIKQRAVGDTGDGNPMDIASQPSLLVIDDLGTQKNSEWVHERLYVLINRRYLDCKPTIVTSNHTSLHLLRDSLGDRATSRLLEQCRIVPVDGPDLRSGARS